MAYLYEEFKQISHSMTSCAAKEGYFLEITKNLTLAQSHQEAKGHKSTRVDSATRSLADGSHETDQ